ncbi:AAA family ATPase [Nocardioides sp. Root190]|uniref:bifunctional aminoglycoside phosphotransferase/ATP-binding protein n=1 Tax=Nocardioides sp. Root190 TaxID=1736488 RepID=UPI0009EAE654|nr:AAA family ATPase [Nocardioides sp. Root190]
MSISTARARHGATQQHDVDPRWTPWCTMAETHSGVVIFVGDKALKIKKPVDLGFLDFRDVRRRRVVCEREVELNRRLAPDVYLGVGNFVGPDGESEPVVVMRRLPDQHRLSALVRSGADIREDVRRIARTLATFHAAAATDPGIQTSGTRAALRQRWEANLSESGAYAGRFISHDDLAEVTHLVTAYLDGRADLFDDRIARGAIVDGHGDLTPDDVFCLPDGPRLLDCLEFDDRLRHVDRLDDVAFLAMGLEALGAEPAAETLVAAWIEYLGEPAPPSLLHHFIAYRAFVRAKVACVRAAQTGADHSPEVDSLVQLTLTHLRAAAVKLVLVGGAPGCGKSTLAGAVADRLGMVSLSSDRLRKEIAGIDPWSSAAAPLGQGLYDNRHTSATYDELLHRAELLLHQGESVVLDASWTLASDRDRARALATAARAELVELRCDVDPVTAARRIAARHDVSDADGDVAGALRRAAQPWPSSHLIDTALPVAECTDQASALIRPSVQAQHTSVRPGPDADGSHGGAKERSNGPVSLVLSPCTPNRDEQKVQS